MPKRDLSAEPSLFVKDIGGTKKEMHNESIVAWVGKIRVAGRVRNAVPATLTYKDVQYGFNIRCRQNIENQNRIKWSGF